MNKDLKIIQLQEALRQYEEENDQLKAENKELKNAYARLNALYNDNCNFTGKLEETLTEIKEICKTNVCKHCYSKFKVDDNYCKSRKDCDCYNILQKINEVEDEN